MERCKIPISRERDGEVYGDDGGFEILVVLLATDEIKLF